MCGAHLRIFWNIIEVNLNGKYIKWEYIKWEYIKWEYNILNGNISNGNILNGNISNGNISNGNISNGNISNENISNANILNANISNTNIMCKYNIRNGIGYKFLYDKILIKIYDITGKIRRNFNNWRTGAKRRLRGTCPESGGAGGEKRAS